jgi:aspartyl-tRNA(Asn)/glutamyl-tRNA(Gln) amidotransferase subunit A
MPAEVSSNLARFDGMRYGLRIGDDDSNSVETVMRATRERGFGNEVKRRVILGTYALSAGYRDAFYGSAQKVRTLIAQDFDAAFQKADVLVSTATPTTAFKIGERLNDPLAMYKSDLCTIPSNLAGNAAASIPCGLAPEDGLPVGFQIMAPALGDALVYRVGAVLESLLHEQWGGPLLDRIPDLEGASA